MKSKLLILAFKTVYDLIPTYSLSSSHTILSLMFLSWPSLYSHHKAFTLAIPWILSLLSPKLAPFFAFRS